MSEQNLPLAITPDGLTPEWLSGALRSAGILDDHQHVVDRTVSAVGTGQMCDSLRVIPTYSDGAVDRSGGGPPATFIAKIPAADETSRTTGVALGAYEREVNFYEHLAAHVTMRTPGCLYLDRDADSGMFVLLLEDLAPSEQGDQLAGCSVDHAAIAVTEAARLHGSTWDDPTLPSRHPWLAARDEEAMTQLSQLVSSLYPGFCERYADRLDDDIVAMGERFTQRLMAYYRALPDQLAVVHGDYRLDNMLFGTAEGGPQIAVVDWQTLSIGAPLADVSYFIGAGLLTEQRRASERELVSVYLNELAAQGVTGFDPELAWSEYRRTSFGGFHMAVVASMIVERTDRGDDMFVAMAQRHGRQVIDLDSEALLT